eukprot:gene6409-7140_t
MAERSLPKPKHKVLDGLDGVQKFNWNEVNLISTIGTGSFGFVMLAKYKENHVVLKQPLCGEENTKEFIKEVKLLNSLKGHDNIAEFKAVCWSPFAIMQEYVNFSFAAFEDETNVSSLSMFLSHINEVYDFAGFEHVTDFIVNDILNGMLYIHERDIIHRDLKPANILVSNQHIFSEDKTSFLAKWISETQPVICKLSDFGESRSRLVQTQTVLVSKVAQIDRGSPVYMAPEILLKNLRPALADMETLKAADMWAVGMCIFVVTNANQPYPFHDAFLKCTNDNIREALEDLVSKQQRPSLSTKYEKLHATAWWPLVNLSERLTSYDQDERITSVESAVGALKELKRKSTSATFNLKIHQGSAFEMVCEESAKQFQQGLHLPGNIDVTKDGTNACVFLALKLCDELRNFTMEINEGANLSTIGSKIADLTHVIINDFPGIINPLRDRDQIYTPSEAKVIMAKHGYLEAGTELSEEMPFIDPLLSAKGRKNLMNSLNCLMKEKYSFLSIYTFEPYSIIIGKAGRIVFSVDTHAVPKLCDGDGNAQVKVYDCEDVKTPTAVCLWIWSRAANSGISAETAQSLAIVSTSIVSENAEKQPYNPFVVESCLINLTVETEGVIDNHDASSAFCSIADEPIHQLRKPIIEPNSQDSSLLHQQSAFDDNIYSSRHVESSNSASSVISLGSTLSGRSTNEREEHSTGKENTSLQPDGEAYKGDTRTPVFSWRKEPYEFADIAKIMLSTYTRESLCVAPPINVSHNVSFLAEYSCFTNWEDLKCDDMGAWKHTGSPKRYYHVDMIDEKPATVTPVTKSEFGKQGVWRMKRIYYKNKSDCSIRKTISIMQDATEKCGEYIFLEYRFKGEEHEITAIKPHGNSKSGRQYIRVFPGVRDKLRDSKSKKQSSASGEFDKVYLSSGDVLGARSLGELPRGRSDLYNARRSASSSTSTGKQNGNEKVLCDEFWSLLEKAKRESLSGKGGSFIRECSAHPELFVVLATDRQLQDIEKFCTDPREFCVYGIDPTFNIFKENISLTVTTYRNLRLMKRDTNKPPMFIGPVLMHQRKDWRTYSRFAHRIVLENPALEAIIACGTDGEKAIMDGCKRNFPFAIFLRCFIHFKGEYFKSTFLYPYVDEQFTHLDFIIVSGISITEMFSALGNIEREITRRGLGTSFKKAVMNDIFGKQEEHTKFYGLVDCDDGIEFDTKLKALQVDWVEKEKCDPCRKLPGQSFHAWFTKEKAEDIKDFLLKPVRIEAGLGNPPDQYTTNDNEAANQVIKKSLHYDPQDPQKFIEHIQDMIEGQSRNEDRAVFGKGPYKVRDQYSHLEIDDRRWEKMTYDQKMAQAVKFRNAGMDNARRELQEKDSDDDGVDDHDDDDDANHRNRKLSISAVQSGIKVITPAILESMWDKASDLLRQPKHVFPQPGATNGAFSVVAANNKLYSVIPGKGGSFTYEKTCIHYSTKICEHTLAAAQANGTIHSFINWFKRSKKKKSLVDLALVGGPKTAGKKPSNRKRSNNKRKSIEDMVDIHKDKMPLQTHSAHVQTPPVSACHPIQHVLPPASLHPSLALPGKGNRFSLKWVAGTRISKCYGCRGDIINPPTQAPEDLVVVYQDMRQYRDRATGNMVFTSEAQNVHFHLRLRCILAKYMFFNPGFLEIPPEFIAYFQEAHLQRLSSEFGLIFHL